MKRFTDRDKAIIGFIEKHKIVNSNQLKRLFGMTDATLSRRMKFITENSEVKKFRYNPQINFYDNKYKELIPNNNCYYWKRKPTNIMHTLLVNEVYLYLKERFDIIDFELEHVIQHEDFIARADIYFSFRYNGREWDYLIEVENNKGFNYSKYLKLEEGGIILPKIIVLTDRRIYNKTKYEVIKARLNLSDLENKVKQDIIEQDFGYKIKG